MLVALIALILFFASGAGIYLLLKSMGEAGVEVAAPGSCKSGKCGVQSRTTTEACPSLEQEPLVEIDEVKREGTFSNNQIIR